MTLSDFLGVLLLLMLIQVLGTHLQIKKYRRTVGKLHKLGNVGVGARRGKLSGGNIVIIACDAGGTITGAEEMRGMTIFTGFKELPELVGRSIYDLKAEYTQLPEDEAKAYTAHVQALEALENRLKSEAEKSDATA